MIKIGFFGTPELAKSVLVACVEHECISVEYVVTQPDKPVGRHAVLTPSPVKEFAIGKGIPVFTPASFRKEPEAVTALKAYEVDYLAVIAYGQILPKGVLDLPKRFPVNVHGSILPEYRWASPIQSVLLDGKSKTGVTIMKMSEGMDEGDILSIREIAIDPEETSATLFKKFSEVSPGALIDTLLADAMGQITPVPQDHSQATYCKKISKEDGRIDWNMTAEEIYHRYQAYTPWPGIWCTLEDKRLKVLRVRRAENIEVKKPGTVFIAWSKCYVSASDGTLELLDVQLEGKNAMDANGFFRTKEGAVLR